MRAESKPFTRKKPEQLVYLELGSGNGGMLLSISGDGFRFRAVSPLRGGGPMPFAFSLDGLNRWEGVGEVESLEDDGKCGGIRFTQVSGEFRTKLNDWLSADSALHSSGREVTPPAAAPLDTMEKIRRDLRTDNSSAPRQTQPVAPRSIPIPTPTPPSIAKPVAEEEAAPIAPVPENLQSEISDRPIPDPPVPTQSSVNPPVTEQPVVNQPNTILPAADRVLVDPVAEQPAAQRPIGEEPIVERRVAARPIVDRMIPAREPKPLISEGSPEAKDAPNAASWLFPNPPARAAETEKPAAPASAFLKLARETTAPAAPVATAAPDVSVPIAPDAALDAAPETPASPPSAVAAAQPLDAQIPVLPREYVEPLDTSLDLAWEQAKLSAPEEPPHLSRAAAGGIIALALAVILGALAYNFRQNIGAMIIELGQAISGENRAAAPARESAPETQPNGAENPARTPSQPEAQPLNTPADSASAGKAASEPPKPNDATGAATDGTTETKSSALRGVQNTGLAAAAAPAKPPENSLKQNPAEAANKSGTRVESGTGQQEFDAAREMLRGKNRQRDLSKAVDLLWAGVKKGYVPAEVTLGDLYLRGDGVIKSCDQARVLLVAASKKGSSDARQKLEQLAEQGCK